MVASFEECERLVKTGIPLFEILAISLFKNLTLEPPVESRGYFTCSMFGRICATS